MTKEIIAITNDKGGVGKTTTAQNLAMGLILKGYKVLVIDADPQRNISSCYGWDSKREKAGEHTLFTAMTDKSDLPVYKSERGVYYTPSSEFMTSIDPFLNTHLSPNMVLSDIFKRPFENNTNDEITSISDIDYVFIDCPPSLGLTTLNAMAAATGLIIPAQLEAFSIRGLGNITAKFTDVKRSLNPHLTIRGFLQVMADERLRSSKVYSQGLQKSFTDLVFKTKIRRNIKLSEAQDSSSDIFEYAPESAGAKDYMLFTEEFLETSPIKE